MVFGDPPKVVHRRSGPGTITGAGDILTDSNGRQWQVISAAEASMLRSGTMVAPIATLHPDGTIR